MYSLWNRLTGKHREIRQQNEEEAYRAVKRDDKEREGLVGAQLKERAFLQTELKAKEAALTAERAQLRADAAAYVEMNAQSDVRDRSEPDQKPEPSSQRQRGPEPDI